MNAGMTAAKEWQFARHGRQLAVMEWGPADGEPIIALHGWLDNAASFSLLAQLLAALKPELRIIALDFAGHGLSDHLGGGQSYYSWDHVADVYALLAELKLKQVALLGHSLGAGVATLLAAAFPERISQLFLIDGLVPLTYPVAELPQLMAKAVRRSVRLSARLSTRSLKPYASFEQAVVARMNSRWPVSEVAAIALLERGLQHTEQGWVWRSDMALTQPSVVRLCEAQLVAVVQQLRMPVLLVMVEDGEELVLLEPFLDEVSDLTLYTLVGSHHLHLEDKPARLISGWISARLTARVKS